MARAIGEQLANVRCTKSSVASFYLKKRAVRINVTSRFVDDATTTKFRMEGHRTEEDFRLEAFAKSLRDQLRLCQMIGSNRQGFRRPFRVTPQTLNVGIGFVEYN